MNIKTVLKSSVAVAALFAVAAPAANAEIKNGNKNSLTVSGQVVRVLWHADDGHSSELFMTDGGNVKTRVRWVAAGKLSGNVTVGATIEMDTPISNTEGSSTLHTTLVGVAGASGADTGAWGIRHQYIWAKHKTLGKVTIGHTAAASDGASSPSFSRDSDYGADGTTFGSGLFFISRTAAGVASLSTVTVGAADSTFDGGRDDNIRYDTPSFGGFSGKISAQQGGAWDTALAYSGKFGAVQVKASIGYDNNEATSTATPFAVFGGVAVKHDSGLSASYGGGKQMRKSNTLVGKFGDNPAFRNWTLGYSAKLFAAGGTNFGFTYTNVEDGISLVNHEDSDSVIMGVTASQKFDAVGLSMQLSYRNYAYDSKTNAGVAGTFDDIDVISLQTIFTF